MPKKRDKIIIDTNLGISFLLTNDFSKLDQIFIDNSGILLFSQTLLNEFIEVAKAKIQKILFVDTLESLLVHIKYEAEFVNVTSHIKICHDPKDDFLLSLAKDGRATHLTTGDKDLLEFKIFENTKNHNNSRLFL